MKGYDYLLDATGEAPPVPTILCKEALNRMEYGQVIKLMASFEGTVSNIRMLVAACNYELISAEKNDAGYVFLIRKAAMVLA